MTVEVQYTITAYCLVSNPCYYYILLLYIIKNMFYLFVMKLFMLILLGIFSTNPSQQMLAQYLCLILWKWPIIVK